MLTVYTQNSEQQIHSLVLTSSPDISLKVLPENERGNRKVVFGTLRTFDRAFGELTVKIPKVY